MKYSFDAKPNDPTQKHVQFFSMLGTRAVWQDGWKAVAVHAPLTDKGHFDQDKWELYNVEADRSESKDLAKQYPEKLESMKKLWLEEAQKNNALPLDDRTTLQIINMERPSEESRKDIYTYYPHTSAIPEAVAVNVIFAGDVNVLLLTGDVMPIAGAALTGLIRLFFTFCALIVAACDPADVCNGFTDGLVYDTVTLFP